MSTGTKQTTKQTGELTLNFRSYLPASVLDQRFIAAGKTLRAVTGASPTLVILAISWPRRLSPSTTHLNTPHTHENRASAKPLQWCCAPNICGRRMRRQTN